MRKHSVKSSEEIISLKDRYSTIALYGTGEVAELFWEKYSSFISIFENVIVCKSNVADNELFRDKKISKATLLSGLSGDSAVVLVITHENVQSQIINNISDFYNGEIYCLTEKIIGEIRYESDINRKMADGMLPMTYVDIPNMGDRLNVMLMDRLFDQRVYCEWMNFSIITGIGSFLDGLFTDEKATFDTDYPLYIWGSGFGYRADISNKYPLRNDIRFCCVRGYKSKKKLEKYYGSTLRCSVGDPGLLAYFLRDSNIEKRFSIGIIPHWREQELLIVRDLYKNYKNSLVINLRNPTELVLQQIAECEVIISSSLHGAIIADAFEIPNILVQISEIPNTDGFKYEDYYSVFGMNGERVDLRRDEAPSIETIKKQYPIDYSDIKEIATQIRESYPFINQAG